MKKDGARKRILGVGLGVLGLVFLGLIIRGFFERTIRTEAEIEVAAGEETEAEVSYLKLSLKTKILTEYLFRQGIGEEFREEIQQVKRGVERIETEKLKGVFREDKEVLEGKLEKVEAVLSKDFSDAGEKQLEFMEAVEEFSGKEKVRFFVARVGFSEERNKLDEIGVLVLNGAELLTIESEEGVLVFLGGEEGVGMNTERFGEDLLETEGEVFSVSRAGRKAKIGEKIGELVKRGRFTAVKVDFSAGRLEKTEVSMRGKGTWDLREELEARGFSGIVGEEYVENNVPGTLIETLERLEEE